MPSTRVSLARWAKTLGARPGKASRAVAWARRRRLRVMGLSLGKQGQAVDQLLVDFAAWPAITCSAWWQAARWPGATGRSTGAACRQAGWRQGQRAAKAQPAALPASGAGVGIGRQQTALLPAGGRLAAAAHTGHGVHQRPGVGVGGGVEQDLGRALLHHPALVEHQDLVADQVDHRQVVADEQVGHAQAVLQVLHQVEHLGLHRHVQRADRLVGHDQLGLGDQGAGDGDALALAARKLMRVLVHVAGAQAHRVQHGGGALRHVGGAAVALRGQRLGDDAAHGLARVQRAEGVLEHHLEAGAGPAQRRRGQGMQVLPGQAHRAGGGRFQRHHQPRQRALARAGFAHHAQAVAGAQLEADALQRPHHRRCGQQALARQGVVPDQVVDLQQHGHAGPSSAGYGGRSPGGMAARLGSGPALGPPVMPALARHPAAGSAPGGRR